MKKIKLTRGQVAIVDDADFQSISNYTWYAMWNRATNSFYAARKSPRSEGHKTISMARFILGLTDRNTRADHIDHNTLNNRRDNLRVATPTQNGQNRRGAQVNSATGVLGVYPYVKTGKFQAQIVVNGKTHHLGLFETVAAAKDAREAAGKRLHLEFVAGNLG